MATVISNTRPLSDKTSKNQEPSYEELIKNSLDGEVKKVMFHYGQIDQEFDRDTLAGEGGYGAYNFKNAAPKIRVESTANMKNYWGKTQNWIGIVHEIHDDSFTARLEDRIETGTYEVAEFDTEEVSLDDRKLISEGAIFYWSVGFENRNGQISKQSLIRFKRTVSLSVEDSDSATDRATDFENEITWE